MAAPRFLQRVLGALSDVAAAVVGGAGSANSIVATNNAGLLDISFLPAGIGADTVAVPASEAIAAGALVNLFNNAGVLNMRNADSGTANGGKKCDGFVIAAVASGATGTMYRSGQNTGLTGLTIGADYWLGATGAAATAASSTSGTTSQYVGKAITTTTLDVQPQPPIGIQ